MRNRHVLTALLALAVIFTLAASLRFMHAQSPTASNLPTGVIAAHLVGRLTGSSSGDFSLIGYFANIEGLNVPLFAGDPGEATAMVTFRSDPFQLSSIPNGSAFHVLRRPSSANPPTVKVYLNLSPKGDFSQPDTFSGGQLIGEMRTHGVQGILVPGQLFKLDGTVELANATPLTILGQVLDIGALISTVTVSFTGVPPSTADFQSGSAVSIPFSASAVVAGPFSGQ